MKIGNEKLHTRDIFRNLYTINIECGASIYVVAAAISPEVPGTISLDGPGIFAPDGFHTNVPLAHLDPYRKPTECYTSCSPSYERFLTQRFL